MFGEKRIIAGCADQRTPLFLIALGQIQTKPGVHVDEPRDIFGAFHVPSGKAVREPCCTDLKTFRTEVKDGQVYVDLSAPATTGS